MISILDPSSLHIQRVGASVLENIVPSSQESHLLSQPALAQIAIYYYHVKSSSLRDFYSQLQAAVEIRYNHCWKLFIWEFFVPLQANCCQQTGKKTAKIEYQHFCLLIH